MKVKEPFLAGEGPCVQTLDRALGDIGVERQAYYGGTFVGNHVHKCCKVHNYTCGFCIHYHLWITSHSLKLFKVSAQLQTSWKTSTPFGTNFIIRKAMNRGISENVVVCVIAMFCNWRYYGPDNVMLLQITRL